nr:MAG TPA: hypothetical protein [Caudoviricetes sp.]
MSYSILSPLFHDSIVLHFKRNVNTKSVIFYFFY